MNAAEKVCAFLDEAQVYYLATVEGDQPRVRPWSTRGSSISRPGR